MTNPQIPTDWNPLTYAVDEHNKVVWKQGSHAVAMGLAGKKDTLIPGYKVWLCTQAELPAVRHRIKVQERQRVDAHLERSLDEPTDEEREEWKEFWAEEKERSRVKGERERQELQQRRTELATEAGRSSDAGLITDEEWDQIWRERAREIAFKRGKAAAKAAKNKEEEQEAIKSEREAMAYWQDKKIKADMRAGYKKLYFPKKKKGFEFTSMHGFAIATVLALVAAFHLNGKGSQNYANSYLGWAGVGAVATFLTHKYKDD